MKSIRRAIFRHPELLPPPSSLRDFMLRFGGEPSVSLKNLFIRTGPFDATTDAFQFGNSFPITEENAEKVRARFQNAIHNLAGNAAGRFRASLDGMKLDLPEVPIGIPDFITAPILEKVEVDLIGEIGVKIAGALPGNFGRCGGIAFAGYDFFLNDFPVDERLGTSPPSTGVLSDYIFDRLLDSLELNVVRFLELIAELHVLPVLSKVATAALLAAAGSIAGPIGAALGALIGSQVDIFHFGGPASVLAVTRSELPLIKQVLMKQAATPIGYIFGNTASPTDQHQVLAIGYKDDSDGQATLTVWDNRERNVSRDLRLDLRGSELLVGNAFHDEALKCVFLEKYTPTEPPQSLHLPARIAH